MAHCKCSASLVTGISQFMFKYINIMILFEYLNCRSQLFLHCMPDPITALVLQFHKHHIIFIMQHGITTIFHFASITFHLDFIINSNKRNGFARPVKYRCRPIFSPRLISIHISRCLHMFILIIANPETVSIYRHFIFEKIYFLHIIPTLLQSPEARQKPYWYLQDLHSGNSGQKANRHSCPEHGPHLYPFHI